MTTWADALDRLEAEVLAAEAAAADSAAGATPPTAEWVPPVVAGPPSAAEVERAGALLQRGAQVVHALQGRVEALAAELAAPTRPPRPAASMIDTRI